ncbi:uncharacterized protein TNCV_1671821 [Trichonephila clavipes]|nr:uncharacterized protein TNCV_1671821 [Trichonephila clavipes]
MCRCHGHTLVSIPSRGSMGNACDGRLVECKVMDVYVAGLLLSLKRMAPEDMNVYLDPESNKLKYPCKMCHRKSCAVTKAYLLWRRLTKRESCNLMHGPNEA